MRSLLSRTPSTDAGGDRGAQCSRWRSGIPAVMGRGFDKRAATQGAWRHASSANPCRRRSWSSGGAVAATLLGDSMLYAVMPSRPDDWGLSIGLVGILLSANRLIRLLTNTLAGRLFVWFGPRPPFAAAIVLAMVTTATYGWATSFLVLLLARMVWGMCWSVLRLGAWWTVLDRATDANLGFLMGIYASVVRSGSLVGVLAGGLLTDAIGHEWTLTIFAVVTGLGGLAWLVTSRSTGAYRTAGAAPAAAGDSSAFRSAGGCA